VLHFKDSSHIPSTKIVAHFLALKTSWYISTHPGILLGIKTIYVLRYRVSALRPTSSNAVGPEGCFFLRFLYTNLPAVEDPLSIYATVGIAWWIMTHSSSAALTRRLCYSTEKVSLHLVTLIRLLLMVKQPGKVTER